MSKLRTAIIGCGGRGRQHALGYAASDKVELVACADVKREAAETLAGEFDIPAVYTDYREMLDKEKPTVVSSCLWIPLHLEATLAAVAAGAKLINAEKPMAPIWGDAVRMHKACEDAGAVMTFSHQRRFEPPFIKVRQLAQQGAVGDVRRIEGYCSNLFDWGTHWFDMFFFYNDQVPVEWVMGQIDVVDRVVIFGAMIETNGMSLYRFKNGVTGMLITGKDHGGAECQNRIIGTDGMIEVRGGGEPMRIMNGEASGWRDVDTSDVTTAHENATACYILDSIDAYLAGREPELSSRKALMGTELIFATYESSRRRARVYLPLDIDDSPLLAMLESGDLSMPEKPAD